MLKQLAAQHNQQRNAQSITDSRYEIRWEKSAAVAARAGGGEGAAWLLICDDAVAVQPLVDALTARGHRHRILGLPLSDADEERLAAALRAAVADEPTTRILHLCSPRIGHRAVDAIAVADATPSPERDTATLLCRGRS